MAATPPSPPSAGLEPTGEYLFKQGDLIFGPVPGTLLIEKLATGEIGAETLVAREGGAFAPIREVTVFMTHAAKASARRKVEEQQRIETKRRTRRRTLMLVLVALAASIGVAGAAILVVGAIRSGFFDRHYEELADIEILASPPLVALATASDPADDEIEYEEESRPTGGAAAPSRRSAGKSRLAGAAAHARADGLPAGAAYDPAAIQAVVRANQHRLYPCLKELASKDPTFRGNVPLSFTVGNQGRVVKLWIDRPGHASGPLFGCMEAQLAQWRFPSFPGERPSVSLSFRVGGG